MTNEEKYKKNKNLIFFVIKNEFKNFFNQDIVSAGNLGLWKAILTYDKNSKCKFSSFAIKCIKNKILNEMRKEKQYQQKEISFIDFGEFVENFIYEDADDWEEIETSNIVNVYLSKLNKTDAKLFLDFANLSQREIAKKYHKTQPQISKIFSELKVKILKIRSEIEEKL